MKRNWTRVATGVAAAAAVLSAAMLPALASDHGRPHHGPANARNVILLIGDGMGESEVALARYWAAGADGRLHMDEITTRGDAITHSIDEDGGTADYVPDSAATGTAWATGRKTSDGRISTLIGVDTPGDDPTTLFELAQDAGMRTGNVSTARVTDATPAVQMAHVPSRGCEGPANMGACAGYARPAGPGSIAEQAVDHEIDVILGGAADRFAQTITGGPGTGSTVAEYAQSAHGYIYVTTADELASLAPGTRTLGLFASGHLPTELTGPQAAPGGVDADCTPNPDFTEDVPTVDAMTAKALELLDTGRRGPGFLLQVEGASIDKQDHAANPCQQIGETVAFDRAVAVALAYAREHRDTLVLVSADHSHTSQIIPAEDDDSPGATATLTTVDGQPLQVNYATSPTSGSQDHTGSTVPVFGYGPGADAAAGTIDQADLFDVIAGALRLN